MLPGCGYTTSSLLPAKYRTIYIPPFKNNITYVAEGPRGLYIPLLESRAREKIVDRFLFNGSLRIAKSEDTADMILKGELTGFDRQDLRLTESQEVQEYRLQITVSLTMLDPDKPDPLWTESSFTGEATYFTTGPEARSESAALEDALTDLARRVVERTVEAW